MGKHIHSPFADAVLRCYRWSRCMQTLMNPGERFLTEEWTYPSAVAASAPHGMHPVPVAMDKDGMSPAALRKVLGQWDTATQGRRYVCVPNVITCPSH